MNRKQLIIGGIILIALLTLCIVLLTTLLKRQANESAGTENRRPISTLAYCADNQSKPCVVSFGVDADDNMLVNILLPDLSYPDHYLKITRNGMDNGANYTCRRVTSSPNSAYCIGEKMPPGETLHLMLISTKDETILAEGDLSIIGLAFPTVEIVTPTPGTAVSTETALTPSPTATVNFILPTFTPSPSLNTPSYPNPSYP